MTELVLRRPPGATLAALVLLTAMVAVSVLAATSDGPIALVILAAVGALALCLSPELAAVIGAALLYGNLTVVARDTSVYQIVAGLSLLVFVLPAAYHLLIRDEPARTDATFAMMVVYLGVLLLCSFRAADMPLALADIQQFALEGLLLYWLILNVIRTPRTLVRVMGAVVAVCAFLAALSAVQAVTGNYDAQFGGLAQRELPDPAAGEVRRARSAADLTVADRAAGPIGDPNRYAQILLVAAPWAFFLRGYARTALGRLASLGGGMLIVLAVALTYSRGAFITVVGLGLVLAAWRYVRVSRLVVVGAVLVMAIAIAAPGYRERVASILGSTALIDENAAARPDGAIRGRATEMLAAVAVFLDYPWLGVGPGQYMPYYSERYQLLDDISFRYLPRPREAHSLVLALMAETGAVGLAVFSVLVGLLLWQLDAARRYWRDGPRSHLAAAMMLSVLAYLGTGVFLHLAYERYLWFLLGVAGATVQVLRQDAHAVVRR
jgi:hypothetical protein